MKHFFLSIFITLSVSLLAQETTSHLEIDYVADFDMDVEFLISQTPKQNRAKYEPYIRQEAANGIKIDFQLVTDGKKSVYKVLPKVDNTQGPTFVKQTMINNMYKGDLYKDLDSLHYYKEQALLDKNYIIKDSAIDFKWTISRDKMDIAGYTCKKATGVYKDSIQVTAYFAPKLAYKDGPDYTFGLPGLILRTEYSTGQFDIAIYAKSITVKEEELDIEMPSGDNVVSNSEFEEIFIELQKKWKEMNGEGVDTEE